MWKREAKIEGEDQEDYDEGNENLDGRGQEQADEGFGEEEHGRWERAKAMRVIRHAV